jgi:Na+/H+ antiporter
MEIFVLAAFSAGLLLSIILDISMLYALAFGMVLFMLYGRHKGFTWRQLAGMALKGVKTVRSILITFLFIGVMTALWRAAGTIPYIVCKTTGAIRPSVFLLMTFLLNCALSVLTGTSLGTAATIGVICAAMGSAMGVSPLWTGGAVLSGAFFGDRCSPVSTSALLVATVTETDIYGNIRRMIRSAPVPFVLTCLIYLLVGLAAPARGAALDMEALYAQAFRLKPVTVIPAATVLALALLRVNVRMAMGASILTCIPICLWVQGIPLGEVLKSAVTGYFPTQAEAAEMIGGGGAVTMIRVICIVCISAAYSDIFNKTGLLDGARQAVAAMAGRTNPFAAMLAASVAASMISCNQTLAILLSDQLCRGTYTEKEQLAADLEDTAVVVSPLIPWSIAGAVPLATVGAPAAAVATSFYLMLQPLWRLARSGLVPPREM